MPRRLPCATCKSWRGIQNSFLAVPAGKVVQSRSCKAGSVACLRRPHASNLNCCAPIGRWPNTHLIGLSIVKNRFSFGFGHAGGGGWSGHIVGFFGSTVLLWHMTFSVNSLAHVWGKRRSATSDTSRNNWFVAFFTGGEGWHNNHHHHPACARQGFRWWEYDATYWVLKLFAALHIVTDLRTPPVAARNAKRLRDGHLDVGRFRQHLAAAAATAPADAAELIESLTSMAERAGRRKVAVPESV